MYKVPYGKETLEFSLPQGMRVSQANSKPVPPLVNERTAVAAALANPIGAPTLRNLARPGNRVCIVFTDITRSCPDELLVTPILSELKAAGVRDRDITLLCGIGMHRTSTHEDKVAQGPYCSHYRDRQRAANPLALADLGTTAGGTGIAHRAVVNRLVIATE
jgi:nickel-dependent lactate racemase